MLLIRREQMNVLRDYMRAQYVHKMMLHLRKTFPERTDSVSDERLRDVVYMGLKKAVRYNIELENDIRRLLEYMVIYGPRLDSKSSTRWLGDVLRRPYIDGTDKMNLIDDYELTVR